MINSNKIIIIDPKPSINNLINSLRKSRWDIQEVFSQHADFNTLLNSTDFSKIMFALSATDFGISLADAINKKIGLSGSACSSIFYNKIDQYEFIKKIAPSLAFDNAKIFSSISELKSYLIKSNQLIMIRPAVSNINGSAILFSGDYATIENDIAHLFSRNDRVITHPFVQGDSYFINGLVINGKLHATDAWQCFNLLANQRNILVSVINLALDDPIAKNALSSFENIVSALQLKFCPIHFEFVVTKNGIKIVKIVTRLATEPLPTLCNLAGIKSQLEWFDELLQSNFTFTNIPLVSLTHAVADYSFIVRNSGFLKQIIHLAPIAELKSYHQTYFWPANGSYLSKTVCGATYGATFLLANVNRNELLIDIQTCQQLNQNEFFELIHASN